MLDTISDVLVVITWALLAPWAFCAFWVLRWHLNDRYTLVQDELAFLSRTEPGWRKLEHFMLRLAMVAAGLLFVQLIIYLVVATDTSDIEAGITVAVILVISYTLVLPQHHQMQKRMQSASSRKATSQGRDS